MKKSILILIAILFFSAGALITSTFYSEKSSPATITNWILSITAIIGVFSWQIEHHYKEKRSQLRELLEICGKSKANSIRALLQLSLIGKDMKASVENEEDYQISARNIEELKLYTANLQDMSTDIEIALEVNPVCNTKEIAQKLINYKIDMYDVEIFCRDFIRILQPNETLKSCKESIELAASIEERANHLVEKTLNSNSEILIEIKNRQ